MRGTSFVKLGKKIKFNHLSRNRVGIVQKIVDKYGFDINVKKKIYDMSVSENKRSKLLRRCIAARISLF